MQRVMSSNGQLLYVKRQTGHIHRSLLHPFGRPTVLVRLDPGFELLAARVVGSRRGPGRGGERGGREADDGRNRLA